jgi:hypothetical protein
MRQSSYDKNEIYFYSKSQKFFEFSNFYYSPFEVNGVWWPTVEHFFQAHKTNDMLMREVIRTSKDPAQAKAMGRRIQLRNDWHDVRDDLMYMALKAKFSQNKIILGMLLSTGDDMLYEKSPTDTYWGYKGQNRMGEMLMKLRDELA